MTEPRVNQNIIPSVTIDQISRLERALMAMRNTAEGSSDILDMIALMNYKEIIRLRQELDASLGFDPIYTNDLVMSLQGERVDFMSIPSSIIETTLANLRKGVQAISAYLAMGRRIKGGRYPSWLSDGTNFQLTGLAGGSVRIMLNIPELPLHSSKYEREAIEKGIELFLQSIHWVSSSSDISIFMRAIEDQYLASLLLNQVRRVVPAQNGIVECVEFSGKMATSKGSYVLTPKSVERIRYALHTVINNERSVTESGRLGSVDIDKGIFELRDRSPYLVCEIPDGLLPKALRYMLNNITVSVEGLQRFDNYGRPTQLIVDKIYEYRSS